MPPFLCLELFYLSQLVVFVLEKSFPAFLNKE